MSALFDADSFKNNEGGNAENNDNPGRFQIVSEVVSSEQKYVELLNVLNSLYIVPLEAALKSSPILDEDKMNSIFGNLTEIKNLNGAFFYKMKERLNSWTKTSLIGDIFIDFGPYFKIYMSFVNNQREANEALGQEMETNPRFKEFSDKCYAHPVAQNQSLPSFLILPIQRIPRYLMLLKDLIKHTDENHPDYENLTKAVKLIGEVAIKIDLAIEDHDNTLKILDIQTKFIDDVIFIETRRRYLHEGLLTKICRNTKKRYMFYLFTNLLVYASKGSGNSYRLHQSLDIDEYFKVSNLIDTKSVTNRFQIVSSKKSFEVFAMSKEEKDRWMEKLNEAMERSNLRKVEKTVYVKEAAPVWEQDVSSKNCKICNSKFNIINRRHHCRRCGVLVCKDCSKNRFALNTGSDPVRICDNCTVKRVSDMSMKTGVFAQGNNAYLALKKYKAKDTNELSLAKGDEVIVINKDPSGWWTGLVRGKTGVFPSTFVAPRDGGEKKAPENFIKKTVERFESSEPSGNLSKRHNKPLPSKPSIHRLQPSAYPNPKPFANTSAAPKPAPKPIDLRGTAFEGQNVMLDVGSRRFNLTPVNTAPAAAAAKTTIPHEGKVPDGLSCFELVKNERVPRPQGRELRMEKAPDAERAGFLTWAPGARLLVQFYSAKQRMCYCMNRETGKQGWVSEDELKSEVKAGQWAELQRVEIFLECGCPGFVANAFRPTLCKHCFHNVSSHIVEQQQ